jgi:DNA-binding CsgD family transcriptional regulator
MGKSSHLTFDQIREVFRIVQEAIDLGNDAVAWRRQMLMRICKLINAFWGVSFVIPMQFNPKNLKPPVFVYTPMPRETQRIFTKLFLAANASEDPLTPVIGRLADRPVTLLRRQMVNDDVWYNSVSYKGWRKPMGVDDIIHSHDPLPQFGVMAVLGFTRLRGDPPFEQRDAKIVDLLRAELSHRWINAAAAPKNEPLTTRQQQLLAHLKGSLSEKQIAAYMGLSRNTTHNHVASLYRRLNVTSRAELLVQQEIQASRAIRPKIGYGGF